MAKRRNTIDYTKMTNNPARSLLDYYDELTSITDKDELLNRTIEVVKANVGHGMSEENYRRFLHNINNAHSKGYVDLLSYVSNFLLKSMGHGVIKTRRESLDLMKQAILESPKDYSKIEGNPTSVLMKHYGELMEIEDSEELLKAAVALVKPLVGKGMSEANYRKFMHNIVNAYKRGHTQLQFFISNYILAGSGEATVKLRRESVEDIARVITESPDIWETEDFSKDFETDEEIEIDGRFVTIDYTLNAQFSLGWRYGDEDEVSDWSIDVKRVRDAETFDVLPLTPELKAKAEDAVFDLWNDTRVYDEFGGDITQYGDGPDYY